MGPEHVLEVSAAEDEQAVEAFGPDGTDERFGVAFARGARTGAWVMVIPSLRKTSSKAPVNLLSTASLPPAPRCSMKPPHT